MTITEQLQFSVVTAPLATLDRRTLSQAWYSALYGHEHPKQLSIRLQPARSTGATHRSALTANAREPDHRARIAARSGSGVATLRAGVSEERRAERSRLARKIERTFLRRPLPPRSATFTVESGERIAVLLRSNGSQNHLVVICSPKAEEAVRAALAQARYALAARGLRLHAEARAEASQ